jgi:hypothetical protein
MAQSAQRRTGKKGTMYRAPTDGLETEIRERKGLGTEENGLALESFDGQKNGGGGVDAGGRKD